MDFLTVLQVSELLKIERQTVNSLIQRGELKAYKIGKLYRIEKEDFIKFLNDNATK